MRNLKKILALVLALVMSMSLLATANAFNDDAEIDPTYDEAVTVLANLGVFQGYNNGETFVPKGSITRAEVAAILYRIATGDVDNTQVSLYADYNTFNDVKSTSWYAGYVNYCANAEYIKGYDDKTFGPNDPVTGYQALAMILRAVGYDVNDEFTGTSWQVKVASTANQLGITRNITAGTLGTAATREVVAEILFRTIAEAYIVEYTTAFGYQPVYLPTSSNNNGSAGNLSGNIARATLGFRTFGLELTEGEISAVGRTAGTTTLNQTTVAANDTRINPVTVTGTDTPWTNIGYQAYVYTVPTTGVKTRAAVSDLVVTGQSLLVTTDGTTFANAINGRVTVEVGANVYYNGELMGQTANAGQAAAVTNTLNLAALRGVKVDYIDNDNGGNAEAVVVTQYTVANVLAVTTDTTTTGTNGSYETRVYVNIGSATPFAITGSTLVTNDELAVGDWVTYVQYPWRNLAANTTGDFYVTEAPATSAKYTARVISVAADTVYTIGGNNYFISDLEYVTDATPDNGVATTYLADNTNQSKDVTIYTDPYGYIVMAQATVATNSYLYVISNAATNPNTGLTEAVVALSDGTISTVQIANLAVGNENAGYIYAANALVGMYTYSTNAAGNYVLNTQQSRMTAASYTAKTATINGVVNGAAASRKVDLTTVVVDLRNYTVGATSAPVYTGYNEIPTVQNTVIWVNTGNANSAVAVGFLLQNSNTIKQDFIVYQTTEYQQIVSGLNNQTSSYTMDVLVGDTVSEDYALTIGQFNTIQTYGVGIYSFISNDGGKNFSLVEYTSFDEVWGTAVWGNGVISFTDRNGVTKNYTYDSQNLVVVDVTNRRVTNNLGLVWGNTTKAYIANAGTASQIVYAILGTEAPATTQDINGVTVTVSHPTQLKDAVTYKYNVATGFITKINDETNMEYTVNLNGAFWQKVKLGTEITLPNKTADMDGTGMKVTMGGKDYYYAYGSKLTVTKDVAITTGHVSWTLKNGTVDANGDPADLIVPVPYLYGSTNLADYLTLSGEHVKFAKSNGTVGFKPVDGALYADMDATFEDGFYKVTVTSLNGRNAAVTAGQLLNDDGTVATSVAAGTYYAKAGTVITVYASAGAGSDQDAKFTVTDVDININITTP